MSRVLNRNASGQKNQNIVLKGGSFPCHANTTVPLIVSVSTMTILRQYFAGRLHNADRSVSACNLNRTGNTKFSNYVASKHPMHPKAILDNLQCHQFHSDYSRSIQIDVKPCTFVIVL